VGVGRVGGWGGCGEVRGGCVGGGGYCGVESASIAFSWACLD